MYKLIIMVIGAMLLMSGRVLAQTDLLELLEAEQDKVIQYTEATFKGSRLINGHTIETRKQGVLEFLISHRFGRINAGAYEFFGLDGANIRLGLEYGITDWLNIGVGRNSFEKTYDGFLKYKVLRQSSGECVMPFSVVGFTSMTVKTLKGSTPTDEDDFSSKLTYTYQLLIARKFNSRLSLQVMPTLIHRNVITEGEREHNLFALGAGGRYKITNRLSLNAEYYYRFNVPEEDIYYNSLSIGIDIETGGHVFQLHITNSQAMIEKGFIEETTGDFFKGDIHFGFNVSRSFNVNVKK
jgi:opacity protein-like surface antigen